MVFEVIFLGVILLISFVCALVMARPKSKLHTVGITDAKKYQLLIFVLVAITVLCCTVPMNLSPLWNGVIPEHRNQYEKITEAFLDGHLYFNDVPSEALVEMEDPYDMEARLAERVPHLWDHAYYNGRYYMYFGVVPVFLAFLPYRIITGTPLTTYHATQLFTAAFIIGLFALLYELAKKFFRELPLGIYLSLSVAVGAISVWNAVSTPALYCTAITAGMATMIWGLFFWVKALWGCERRVCSVIDATVGSFFGALTFGCRPPIALANIIILGLMVYYLKIRQHKGKWLDLALSVIPYAVIGVLLMVYNYVRFESIFEFGQSYQLTQIDVKNLPSVFKAPTLAEKWDVLRTYAIHYGQYLLEISGPNNLLGNGTFIMFPILIYIVIGLINRKSRALIRQDRFRLFLGLLTLTPFIILVLDVLGSPEVLCRYRMDTYWIFGLLCYFFIGLIHRTTANKKAFSSFICYFSIFTTAFCVLLFLYPSDGNFGWFIMPTVKGFFAQLLT